LSAIIIIIHHPSYIIIIIIHHHHHHHPSSSTNYSFKQVTEAAIPTRKILAATAPVLVVVDRSGGSGSTTCPDLLSLTDNILVKKFFSTIQAAVSVSHTLRRRGEKAG